MNGTLTATEENFIKDLLMEIERNRDIKVNMLIGMGMARTTFNRRANDVFKKLQNGRLTVISS